MTQTPQANAPIGTDADMTQATDANALIGKDAGAGGGAVAAGEECGGGGGNAGTSRGCKCERPKRGITGVPHGHAQARGRDLTREPPNACES